MRIGTLELENNIFLAPMAGVTDKAFRMITKSFGPALMYTEMVSGKGLHYNSQRTEDLVGPYELHDFFLYYMLRWGFPPRKIYRLALYALGKTYTPDVILKWLKTFYRRFFSQQFKRSCLPDGPKVGSAALSPRGDWRMPSDASAALWQAELETLESVHF